MQVAPSSPAQFFQQHFDRDITIVASLLVLLLLFDWDGFGAFLGLEFFPFHLHRHIVCPIFSLFGSGLLKLAPFDWLVAIGGGRVEGARGGGEEDLGHEVLVAEAENLFVSHFTINYYASNGWDSGEWGGGEGNALMIIFFICLCTRNRPDLAPRKCSSRRRGPRATSSKNPAASSATGIAATSSSLAASYPISLMKPWRNSKAPSLSTRHSP